MSSKRQGNLKTVVEFDKVSFGYGTGNAVEDVTLKIYDKDFFGIIGPNGGGKTTLIKLILGLESVSKGKLLVFGSKPGIWRKRIGYVPQYTNFDFNFPISVRDVVLTGRLGNSPLLFGYSTEDKNAASETMESLGIDHLKNRRLGSLSGGERQRVLIARALVSDPDLLILDEPTSSVDIGAEENIYGLLKGLNESITIILISHDIGFVTSHVNKVACLNKKLVCHPAGKINAAAIGEMYNQPVHWIHHHKKI